MKRKIYDELKNWKEKRNGEVALLIDGARRVGKSYIVKEFAEKNYKTYILIDFYKVSKKVKDVFENYLDDLDTFFLLISSYYNVKLYNRDTLFIFDEVEFFPRARAAIKYLVEDGRYDYIETGSLISIQKNVKNILIPSEEQHIKMYPMDFEEFLWATGNDLLIDYIRKSFVERKPLGQLIHRKVMNIFREYLIVGGMPQAVSKFIETNDFDKVDEVKRNILDLYKNDIAKHADGYEGKVRSLFDEIPSQLSRHDKIFRFSVISKQTRFREYEDALFWLSDSMITNHCYNSTEPNIGLRLNMERTRLKCYMGDTGLLVSHAFDENGLVSQEIYKKLLFDKLEVNKGMIFENIVAQMLTSNGHKLYFYSNYSDIVEDRMGIDFLLSKSKTTSRHNMIAIEVKSGKNYTLNSLNKYKDKFNEYVDTCMVIHTEDYMEKDGIIYLPVYMTYLL